MSPKLPDSAPDASSFEDGPRRTMPPPELWDRAPPASVSELILADIRSEPPLLRHAGPRAGLAHQFARAAAPALAGDQEGERDAYLAIAKVLTARATELDTATAAARRALSFGEDPAVRSELGGWLSGLGEPALAAAALRGLEPKDPKDAHRNLIKIAVLLGRAGDSPGAADALREAIALEPSDPMAHELLGMVASWAPDDMPPAEAATAYGHAAERRTAAGDLDAAFEDRLRAFEDCAGPRAGCALAGGRGRRARRGRRGRGAAGARGGGVGGRSGAGAGHPPRAHAHRRGRRGPGARGSARCWTRGSTAMWAASTRRRRTRSSSTRASARWWRRASRSTRRSSKGRRGPRRTSRSGSCAADRSRARSARWTRARRPS